MNVFSSSVLCWSWSFCPIKSINALILSIFNSLAETFSTIESPVDLTNFFSVLRLIHFPLIRELKHAIILRIFRFTIKLGVGIKVSNMMLNRMLVALVHDTGNKLMRVNLLFSFRGFLGLKGSIMLGSHLWGEGKRLGDSLMVWLFEGRDVLSFAVEKRRATNIAGFHVSEVNLFIFYFITCS